MNTTSGKIEFDIFKNYYTAAKRKRTKLAINTTSFQSKDDVKSEHLRGLVKTDFDEERYDECLKKYSECLRYATYNGRQFAMALANRSATYFFMKKYQNCLIDINLCLQADYPNIFKPKVLLRKANCLVKMGHIKDMMKSIDECCKIIRNLSTLPKINKDMYLTEIKSLMDTTRVNIEDFPMEDITLAHDVIVQKNKLNPNVSASIKLKYNKDTGTDYVAARDIPCGEVLFVDPAYSVGCLTMDYKELGSTEPFICGYCYMEARNCIACKICVNFIYCSENCRDEAWAEFHQWECDMFRSKLVNVDLSLSFRTLIRAALSGAIFQIGKDTKPCKTANEINLYAQIHSLHLEFASGPSKYTDKLALFCKHAVYMVEFLKRADFFKVLMSTASCQTDYCTLINLVGGLLLKHFIQRQQRSLAMKYASTIALDDYCQKKLPFHDEMIGTNGNFVAFCPTVSSVKYSCESNTCMYFNGSTCVVKACKNIKAGNRILRSGLNMTLMSPFSLRPRVLQSFDINCDCTACEEVTNNIDILDTYRCIDCGNFALLPLERTSIMRCLNCNLITTTDTFESRSGLALSFFMRSEYAFPSFCYKIDVKNKTESFSSICKKWLNPYHGSVYNLYRDSVNMWISKIDFSQALQNFKTCAEKRNGRFDAFDYILDLAFICKASLAYVEFNDFILQSNEIVEMLNYVSDVVKEAKDISEYTFPPLLRLFARIEFRVLTIRLTQVTLKDV